MVRWNGNYGLELNITKDQAMTGSHQGACDDDIAYLAGIPVIRRQLKKLDLERLKRELKEYGFDAETLADHEGNLQRILWIACCDIRDNL